MSDGRPIRFLVVTICGWIGLRAVALWPSAATVEDAWREIAMPAAAGATAPATSTIAITDARAIIANRPAPSPLRTPPTSDRSARRITSVSPPVLPMFTTQAHPADPTSTPAIPPPYLLPPVASRESRWALSVWAIGRGGSQVPLLGGQLGGSQAGARLTYAILPAHRIALAARIATPIEGNGREAAIGIDWQPVRAPGHLPIHLIVEQRFGLDGGRGGPAALVVGGIGPRPVRHGITVEGYAQTGVIARDGGVAFADGALRLTHDITRRDAVRLDIGVGSWGGAQPGAARLDIGPTMALTLPVGGHPIRLTFDWRQRVAGRAAPGSGPALSIGSDL